MSFRKRMLRHGPRTGVLAASIGALIATGGLSSTALGQDEEEEEANAADDSIVVTGTRIRRDDFTSTNATVTVTAEDMRNLGVVSVAEMINQLPSNVADINPETNTDSTFNMGASVANLRGMNSTSGSRTLVLVDSRRVIGSNSSGVVDLNMIPTALVGRIETVTGGASATYGAHAMAGVVNVILDNNIEGVRVDLSYGTTAEGDGDDVNLSLGTGFEVFDRRGQITVGYDRQQSDAIGDCVVTREVCRRSFGVFQNGTSTMAFTPYAPMNTNQYFPGLPQYVLTEGFRYARPVEGYWTPTGSSLPTDPGNLALGIYRLTADGLDVVPMYDELPQADRAVMLAAGEGPGAPTPFGQGAYAYAGVPVRPETTRDNLYTRFAYDFESGIELETSLTYGKTESLSQQNSARQSLFFNNSINPRNAFLQPEWGATQHLRDVYMSRLTANSLVEPNHAAQMGGTCGNAPFLGNPGDPDTTTYDYPTGPTLGCNTTFIKDLGNWVERFNTTDTEQWTWSVGANGDLFEGGSWTWDTSLSYSESERFVDVQGWQSTRRLEMAMRSEWDSTANGGAGAAVCSIDNNEPYDGTDPVYPGGGTWGEYWEYKWIQYLTRAVEVQNSPESPQHIFDTLSGRNGVGAPCAPFNPFGNTPYPGSLAFAFPSIIDGNSNEQTTASVLFSGDAWRGFGSAGPVRMAAGLDFRFDATDNGVAGQNNILDRDFGLNFSDDWNGETETQEAFVEFEVPLLRNMPAANYLSTTWGYRYTDNTTRRLAGAGNLSENQSDTRSIESWKLAMVWRPVELMTVRITRSNDTRAPSGTELFAVSRPAFSSSTPFTSPFRWNNTATPLNESQEEALQFAPGSSGNPSLQEETSTTETIGIVFQPTELLAGFSIAIDYSEIDIKGGINTLSAMDVANRCLQELQANGYTTADTIYCQNIVFGDPLVPEDDFLMNNQDGTPNNPLYPFVNIEEISGSSINNAPFLTRAIDVTANYNTQLGGGGFINARLIAARSLEQQVNQTLFVSNPFLGPTFDVSGQTGSEGIASFWGWAAGAFTNYAPTPRISANAFLTYQKNAFSTTGQIRYVGSGDLNNQNLWLGPGDCRSGATETVCYNVSRAQMITSNKLPSWTTLNLNFEYDFSASRFSFDRFESLSVYMNIDNVADRIPDFLTGNATGAQNPTFFSVTGRTYRMGVRMQF
jgi:outer membrane receptor protein involved in Fe transport